MNQWDTVLHAIRAAAAEAPTAVAVIGDDGTVTYGELLARVEVLAAHLRDAGIGTGKGVGVLCERSVAWIVSMLGVWWAGGVYVPMDPSYPAERLNFLAHDAALDVVLTCKALVGQVPESVKISIAVDELLSPSESSVDELPHGNDVAYLIYTSGSTGTPKGVLVEHRSLVSFVPAINEILGMQGRDRLLQFVSPNFDPSVMDVALTLVSGATLVLRSPRMADSFSRFLDGLRQSRVTMASLPTAFWHGLVDALDESFELSLPAELRLIYFGGERADPERLIRWREKFGDRVKLVNVYGPTEVTIGATAWDASEWLRGHGGLSEAPIGVPLRTVEAHVFDEAGRECPVNVAGELYLGGVQLARGYHQRVEATEKAFVTLNGERPSTRLYRTGDRAVWRDDGMLRCLGRIDDQLKIRGYRIEPGEIEAVLRKQPDIKDAVIVGHRDTIGELQLVGYVVSFAERAFNVQSLMQAIRHELPAHMVPAVLTPMDRLPITPNGKVDRHKLPPPNWGELRSRGTPPKGEIEQKLAAIWAELLHVPQIYREDDFFDDLGGHSLLAVQMLTLVDRRLRANLELEAVLTHKTLAGLASVIAEFLSSPSPELPRTAPAASAPIRRLSLLQTDFMQYEALQALLGLGVNPFVAPVCLRLRGPLDVAALTAVLNDIVQRHEVLRAILPRTPRPGFWPISWVVRRLFDQPSISRWMIRIGARQFLRRDWLRSAPAVKIMAEMPVCLEVQTYVRLSDALAAADRDFWPCYSRMPGASFRARLVGLGEHDHVLFIAVDHMVFDGYSVQVLINDLTAFYRSRVLAEAAPPALAMQYFDWVAQSLMEAPKLSVKALEHWRTVYRRVGPVTSVTLPFHHSVWPPRGFRERWHQQREVLAGDEFARVRKFAADHGVTVFVLMMSIFVAALSRRAGASTVSVMTNVANRNNAHAREMIGLIANIFPVVAECSGKTLSDVIQQVKRAVAFGVESQAIPWPSLRSQMMAEINDAQFPRNPLLAPQVLFDFYALRPAQEMVPGLSFEEVYIPDPGGSWLLQFIAVQEGQSLSIHVKHSPDLYETVEVDHLLRDFVAVLSALPESSSIPLSALSFAT